MAATSSHSAPSPLVALASWVVPGSGYLLIGERSRGLTVGLTVIALFILGILIGGIRVVEAPRDLTRPLDAVMDRPWFVGQVLAGPIGLITARIGAAHATGSDPWTVSHSRINEIGTLYTAVAGMLNLLAIIDSAHRATRGGGNV